MDNTFISLKTTKCSSVDQPMSWQDQCPGIISAAVQFRVSKDGKQRLSQDLDQAESWRADSCPISVCNP